MNKIKSGDFLKAPDLLLFGSYEQMIIFYVKRVFSNTSFLKIPHLVVRSHNQRISKSARLILCGSYDQIDPVCGIHAYIVKTSLFGRIFRT